MTPQVLGACFLVGGAALVLHAWYRMRADGDHDWWRRHRVLVWLFTSPSSLTNVGQFKLGSLATDRPDVFLELFYGFAFCAGGVGGLFFFPR